MEGSFMAYFKVLSCICLEGLRKAMKDFRIASFRTEI